jgi:DNA end-binding protein Ku
MAAEAFAVMREGMQGKVGVGKLALYGREYLVAVKPKERGIVMYTLHHAAELRSIDVVEELDAVPETVKPEEIKLARQVISTFEAPLDLASFKDEYREGLQRLIDAKIAGQDVVVPSAPEPPKVVNLMEALKKSLDAVSTTRKKPVKAAMPKAPAARAEAADGAKPVRRKRAG